MVANAAPRIPQPNPMINKASNPQFTMTAVNVAAMAFCGYPEALSTSFNPMYMCVIRFPAKITCIYSLA